MARALFAVLAAGVLGAAAPVKLSALPFNLSEVHLAKGSLFAKMQERNVEFLLSLDNSRLMCLYTSAANLTGTIDKPSCSPYDHPQYWGHYLGHYLSATAMVYEATGDERVKAKADAIISELGKVQSTWSALGSRYTGFLYPYDRVSFDSLFDEFRNCAPVCVPFYVMHKMMAGMLDQHLRAGSAPALKIVTAMASWVTTNVEGVLRREPDGAAQWQRVLGTEWGGMNEALYNLYAVTGDPAHLRTGKYFNHWQWTAPLAIDQDDLDGSHGNVGGNHANTHIPEIIGSARGYELTGNSTQKNITQNFFDIVTSAHSWATGGSNDAEHWGPPHQMGDQLNGDTEESCTTYNILKVARHLFEWSADAKLADFYERALLNGMTGNQRRLDPNMTSFIYMLPLGGGGLRKGWGTSNTGFPCCWGTLSEQFSKLADSVFFRSPSEDSLFVNLFISSELDWPARGVRVVQSADGFPASTTETTRLAVREMRGAQASGEWTLHLRCPQWAVGKNVIELNGNPVAGARCEPSEEGASFVAIGPRAWADGDVVTAYYPMSLRFEAIDDPRPEWKGVGSVLFGPLMLAAVGPGAASDNMIGDATNLESWIRRNDTGDAGPISFEATARGDICAADKRKVHLVAFNTIQDEVYAAYFRTDDSGLSPVSATNKSLPSTENAQWGFQGGAAIVSADAGNDIRTGDPGQHSTSTILRPIQDEKHMLSRIDMAYRYVCGYGVDPATAGKGANFSIILRRACDAPGSEPIATVFRSAELSDYPFDKCHTYPSCYSPPVPVRAEINVDTSEPLVLEIRTDNNQRNAQIRVPLNITLGWTHKGTGARTMTTLVTDGRVRIPAHRHPHSYSHYEYRDGDHFAPVFHDAL